MMIFLILGFARSSGIGLEDDLLVALERGDLIGAEADEGAALELGGIVTILSTG